MTDTRLSVVVTIVDGERALRECLAALDHQVDPPELDVVVPYDDTVAWAREVAHDHPTVRFVDLGAVSTEKSATGPAGQHELFDLRRSRSSIVSGRSRTRSTATS